MAAADTSGYVQVDGARLYYEMAGAGDPVVLIHGGMWDLRMWDPQVPVLSSDRTVIRYDVRGYGRSDRPTAQPYSDRKDLHDLLRSLGLERAAIVGLSMGGRIATDFALEHPGMVEALVLVASAVGGFAFTDERVKQVWDQTDAAVEAGDFHRALELELGLWAPLQVDDENDRRIRSIAADNLHLYQAMDESEQPLEPPALGRLGEIEAPTLVIVGDGDIEEVHTRADLLAQRIPGATRVVIPDADHVVNLRRPRAFDRAVVDFLRSLEKP
jgi:3-oxoadipate enol-lactonase